MRGGGVRGGGVRGGGVWGEVGVFHHGFYCTGSTKSSHGHSFIMIITLTVKFPAPVTTPVTRHSGFFSTLHL